MRSFAILVMLLAGCGSGTGVGGGNGTNPARPPAGPEARADVQTATVTGLYEGGAGPERSQLCILERTSAEARFGLVLHLAGDSSCSGSGSAVREGGVLRLTMEGDQACRIDAQLVDGQVIFPAAAQDRCAYYCGPGATFAGAELNKVGGTSEDAMRARDLVGDPLCG